ncbi:MAG TPA: peptidase M23 [Lutibacter sp.]|nr:peptidase M23 [Lutibacter sp.]
MSKPNSFTAKQFWEATINSYSQVFFSDNKLFGFILLVVSFFDIWAGISGLLAVLTTIGIALALGFSHFQIQKGSYSFNSLLVGLGTGLSFTPGIELFVLVFFAALITFIITLALEGFFAKYALPFLSIPFLIGMWVVVLASRDLQDIGLSERGIYTANELHAIGGIGLVNLYTWLNNLEIPHVITTYLYSLGAIFFQYSLLAGFVIAIGILLYSRISFLLSLVGFLTAYYFYSFLGADIAQYGYTYIGFNFILTAIAIGGHFVVASKQSFLWVLLLLPVVVLFTLSLTKILLPYQLSIYSLPFNIVVLLFLYILKLRVKTDSKLKEVSLQLNNPEKNVYYLEQAENRFKWLQYFTISLPVHGKWKISQAEDGEHTHRGNWKYAWDFIVTDKNDKEFKNQGDFVEDYLCYAKNIIAPASGTVVEIVDGIEDNIIGDADVINNWGNTIIIKHATYLYSQISHIKKGSFKVKKGQVIKKGETLALVGNSGRSPYPHIHFQLQATPSVGSKTLDYPIDHFVIDNNEFNSYAKPLLNEQVSNIKTTNLLQQALKFIPGQTLKITTENKEKTTEETWQVKTDYHNNLYLVNRETNSYAYLHQDGAVHYFQNYSGTKQTALYHFYLALFQVPLGYYQDMEVTDSIPSNLVFSKFRMVLQDFLIPFFTLFKVNYKLKYIHIDNEMLPKRIELKAKITKRIYTKDKEHQEYTIIISENNCIEIATDTMKINITKN